MDTLAGRTKKEHIIGRIGVLQNNNDVTFMNSNQSWEKYRQKIAYVMQGIWSILILKQWKWPNFYYKDDVFLGNLTVRESILYSIELKLPQNHTLSKSQMEEKCSRILSELKLEKVKNSVIFLKSMLIS